MQNNRITQAEQEAASIVFYKHPYSDHYTVVRSSRQPLQLSSYDEIGREKGFVIAPFCNDSAGTPIVLVRPDECFEYPLPHVDVEEKAVAENSESVSAEYESSFNAFHNAVSDGRFRKLVLARRKEIQTDITDFEQLFFDTCARCPRQMVVLFTTPVTGMWLIATPEELLSTDGNRGTTMALAGTMPWEGGNELWSDKNKGEQRVVADYIEHTLKPLVTGLKRGDTYSKRAANLAHLCTDFTFQLDGNDDNGNAKNTVGAGFARPNSQTNTVLGDIISALHPTPAVCGLPKKEAFEFIRSNEPAERKYYSGFTGPVGLHHKTSLYVSLRCAYIETNRAVLYSGGGIMPDSELLSEWEETENKMRTMTDVLE